MKKIFTIDSLTDPEMIDLYNLMLNRGDEAISSFSTHYQPPSASKVKFGYTLSSHFNAKAQRIEEGYIVSFNSPVIAMLCGLFDALLFDPNVLPEIGGDTSAGLPPHRETSFLYTSGYAGLQEVPITRDAHRQSAAAILADFCSTFIVFHEIGHVISGHTDYCKFELDGTGIKELYMADDMIMENYQLFRSWEYDADAIASGLVVQFIDTFTSIVEKGGYYGSVFQKLREQGWFVERMTALVICSLFSMFTLIAQVGKSLNRYSSHPHPLHRGTYTQDMILTAMKARMPIDIKKVLSFNLLYFDQFSESMRRMNLLPYPTLTSRITKDINRETKRIIETANALRSIVSDYSWIRGEEWS